MKKTTEKRIAKWINRFVDREKSKAAWRYRNQNPKIKTLKEAMEKMSDEDIRYPVVLYPFYNEVENLTVYTNGHLVIQVKGKVEGINYYEGNELKPFDYSRWRKLFQNLDDKSRVELYLPETKKLKEYIKYMKKTCNDPCCGYNTKHLPACQESIFLMTPAYKRGLIACNTSISSMIIGQISDADLPAIARANSVSPNVPISSSTPDEYEYAGVMRSTDF